jgi:hypothetical protein
MPLIGFIVFKDKILDGTKRQTIRKIRNHPIKKGDKLYLYWHLRQKDCEKLLETICTEEFTIRIKRNPNGLGQVFLGIASYEEKKLPNSDLIIGHWEPRLDKEEIVKRDGFNNEFEMLKWFDNRYDLPELFQVIRW